MMANGLFLLAVWDQGPRMACRCHGRHCQCSVGRCTWESEIMSAHCRCLCILVAQGEDGAKHVWQRMQH